MRCDAVLEILLEADLDDLRSGEHAGADHVALCPECRRATERILEGEGLLDGWLEAAPPPDTQAILAAATGAEAGPRVRGAARTESRAGAWIALAVAAVAALFLVNDPGPGPGAPDGPPTLARPAGPDGSPGVALGDGVLPGRPATPEIEVPAGRNAAILRTADPDITVIWFYGGD